MNYTHRKYTEKRRRNTLIELSQLDQSSILCVIETKTNSVVCCCSFFFKKNLENYNQFKLAEQVHRLFSATNLLATGKIDENMRSAFISVIFQKQNSFKNKA